jgi:hypothetical protein
LLLENGTVNAKSQCGWHGASAPRHEVNALSRTTPCCASRQRAVSSGGDSWRDLLRRRLSDRQGCLVGLRAAWRSRRSRYLVLQVKGTTGEGLSASQPNASGGSVESTRPAAAMESHPQGAAGSTPKGEHPPVSNDRGFCFLGQRRSAGHCQYLALHSPNDLARQQYNALRQYP